MANMDPGTTALACPEWEHKIYEERYCKSYTCNTCSQEWCKSLCHELKLKFGACIKIPCPPPDESK